MSYPENYQHAADAPLPGDDDPTPLPRRQLQKADAILTAYLEGAEMWAEALPDVAAFLRAGHMHDLISTGQVRGIPTIEETAAALDTWPWPTPPQT